MSEINLNGWYSIYLDEIETDRLQEVADALVDAACALEEADGLYSLREDLLAASREIEAEYERRDDREDDEEEEE